MLIFLEELVFSSQGKLLHFFHMISVVFLRAIFSTLSLFGWARCCFWKNFYCLFVTILNLQEVYFRSEWTTLSVMIAYLFVYFAFGFGHNFIELGDPVVSVWAVHFGNGWIRFHLNRTILIVHPVIVEMKTESSIAEIGLPRWGLYSNSESVSWVELCDSLIYYFCLGLVWVC